MTCMRDLSQDLVVEILSRLPKTCLGAVRCTCKEWNALSRDRILCTVQANQQFLGFMIVEHRLCSMRFDLHGILNEDGEDLDMSTLVVWNPYLGQTRWIKTTKTTQRKTMFVLGYDKNKNHKILSFYEDNQGYCDIYDFKTDSWRSLTFIPNNWNIICHWQGPRGFSVNGNTYFCTQERKEDEDSDYDDGTADCLICFDFTEERFGKFLDLPFRLDVSDFVSCVKEEKLAAVYLDYGDIDTSGIIEIWVTSKIEPNAVSWIPFFKVDIEPLAGPELFDFDGDYDSFFIDEEKKLAVVFTSDGDTYAEPLYKKAYIIGEDSYFKKVDIGEVKAYSSFVCSSSYVPSLVQINQTAVPKSREIKKKKRKRN
ncbi:hypothetical protein CARUB_v10015290mg [Capsella rubella]|uniref:F-box domain-containing protein n=1 Tax=Capsella rubella TaxID=81985 RepID=R0I2D4_9BRAS|nr:hypothetical protein CARUB_v10015290mg [Capsella rubella]